MVCFSDSCFTWWQILLIWILFGAMMVGLERWFRVGGRALFLAGSRRKDIFPNTKRWRDKDDGSPGGPRGKVWTDVERQQYRDRQRNVELRLTGHGCPPHDPEYDESVDETYCSKCLTRLPND